jgi:hypothetical protein
MAYTLSVKYYNSFALKKIAREPDGNDFWFDDYQGWGEWQGLQWNPRFLCSDGVERVYPTFPVALNRSYSKLMSLKGCWYIEESRIKGGFNNSIMDLGVRAYSVNEDREQVDRTNSLIFSGVYNNRTGINNTNVFSVSENIIKDANPKYGSIQKIYAEDTNLIVFQENKVHYALINKNTVYSGAQGAEELTGENKVIGQLVPYLGEYGISRNPESFAIFGYRKYFADKDRSAILRLSRDGITEVSAYGMRDYFRDELKTISDDNERRVLYKIADPSMSIGLTNGVFVLDSTNVENGTEVEVIYSNGSIVNTNCIVDIVQSSTQIRIEPAYNFTSSITGFNFVSRTRDKIYAGYDSYNKNYTLSMQTSPRIISTADTTFNTLSFDENINGWTSFYSYKPIFIDSLKNQFYSFIDNKIYQHYVDNATFTNRCKFYGSAIPDEANVQLVFNPSPSVKKNFNTISYEGTNGWEVESIISSKQGFDSGIEYQDASNPIKSYDEGVYTDSSGVSQHAGFNRKENRYVANIINNSTVRPGEVIFGSGMSGIKGYFTTVKFKVDSSTNVGGMKELFLAGSNYVMSSY